MIRTNTIGFKEVCLTAVSALDELVFESLGALPPKTSTSPTAAHS